MTEDEKRHQKAELLLEYQEQENELAHLREQLKLESLRIGGVLQWMRDYESTELNHTMEVERRHAAITRDPQLPISFDIAKLIELVKSIREANQKLGDLRTRKQNLGLR